MPAGTRPLVLASLCIRPADTIRDALARMTEIRKGVLFVTDDDGRLAGVLSDGDIRRTLLDDTLLVAPVHSVMNLDPVSATTAADAEALLRTTSAVAVPILNAAGHVTSAVVVGEHGTITVVEGDRPSVTPPSAGTVVALIPARGGSRRLPRKNLVVLGGRPLVTWAVDAARSATTIDRVVVSTDDDEIADEARRAGAEVPFRRPPELSDSDARTIDVIIHAVEALAAAGDRPEIGVLLEPTAPFRSDGLVDEVVTLLRSSGADSVVTVAEVPHALHPDELVVARDGALRAYDDAASLATRRLRGAQQPVFVLTGAVYAFRIDTLLAAHDLFGDRCVPLVVPWETYVDIDTAEDLRRAAARLDTWSTAP